MSEARLRVDLNSLAQNYGHFQATAKGEVGGVVKANAYGLGVVPVVQRLAQAGCKSFFVATIEEAAQIRPLVNGTVYVFSPPLHEGLEAVQQLDCVPVINSHEQLIQAKSDLRFPVAVHIDTGMERLGISYQDVSIEELKLVNLQLLMTHLACADDPDDVFNSCQVDRFATLTKALPHVRTSIGNSAGTLNGVRFQGDLVRPGIGLYGANPFRNKPNPLEIVARCEAKVLTIRDVEKGASIGYQSSFTTTRKSRVAVLGMGYADGLPHVLSNQGQMAYDGALLPIIGRISMDLTQIDVTDCSEIKVGDWVEFFGDTIDVDDVAQSAKSFGYEFLTGIGSRVERQYV